MITQDLLNYIKQQIASGKNYDYIVSSLKSVGWSDNDINEAFSLLNVVNNSNNSTNNNHYYNNQNLNLNTNNVNSTYLDRKNKFSISVILSIIFVVLSLLLFVVSIILSFLNLIQNNIILYIIGCLIPLFAFIGLILSIISLKKNKVISIINIIFTVIILLIQLVSFVIGFVTGFNQALNQARNQDDLISSNDESLITTPTSTTNQTPTNIPTTPTPSPTNTNSPTPYFVTQKDKADFIKNVVIAVKKSVNLPKKLNEFLTWTDVVGTEYSIRYIYDAEAASTGEFSRNLEIGFKDLVCNDSKIVNDILSKDITIEYLINFKLDSKQKLLMAKKSDCN